MSKPANFALFSLLLFYSLFFFQKIDLTRADLGQHLKSGEIFFKQGHPVAVNAYSYTAPDFPAVNHRWAAGVIYYGIHSLAGFTGLSFFQIILSVLTVFMFLLIARNKSDPVISTFFFLLSLPLITLRTEIRPESFSYFFLAAYFYVLTLSSSGAKKKWLWALPVFQIFWVNLHIFFFLGPFLILVFWVERKEKMLLKIFAACLAACLVNPFFVRGAFSFLTIFQNHGISPLENRSTMESNTWWDHYFQITLLIFLVLVLAAIVKKKATRHFSALIFTLLMGGIGWSHIRTYPLFGYFFIPASSALVFDLAGDLTAGIKKRIKREMLLAVAGMVGLSLLIPQHLFSPWKGNTGFGLLPENERSAVFFKENLLQGPIFNNYDIGGFLIYELFPGERVFVDNRPEAYPASFFNEIYKPMAVNESVWDAVDKKYGFNAIFSRYDDTPAPKNFFLMRRLNDPQWALVYADDKVVILLKRNHKNAKLIGRLEILPL